MIEKSLILECLKFLKWVRIAPIMQIHYLSFKTKLSSPATMLKVLSLHIYMCLLLIFQQLLFRLVRTIIERWTQYKANKTCIQLREKTCLPKSHRIFNIDLTIRMHYWNFQFSKRKLYEQNNKQQN